MTDRNCWTCKHDQVDRADDGREYHVCSRAWDILIAEWIETHVAPASPGVVASMPPQDAPARPGWGQR